MTFYNVSAFVVLGLIIGFLAWGSYVTGVNPFTGSPVQQVTTTQSSLGQITDQTVGKLHPPAPPVEEAPKHKTNWKTFWVIVGFIALAFVVLVILPMLKS